MDLRPTRIASAPPPAHSGARPSPFTLKTGQRLEAQVIAAVSRQLLLEVGHRRLLADTDLPLQAGDRLQLEVVHTDPRPHLKIIGHLSPGLARTLTMRQALPRQLPLNQALSSLQALIHRPGTRTLLPAPLLSQINDLLDSLPDRDALAHPDTLRTAVRLSGLFAEIPAPPPRPADLKTRLLQLAAIIRATPNQTGAEAALQQPGEETPTSLAESPTGPDLLATLSDKVGGALARIVLDQLASLPKPDARILDWQTAIPFRSGEHIETLTLAIRGDKGGKRKSADPTPWTVDLELSPPGLGQIRIRLVLQGKKISSYWWGKTETTRLLERHLDTLARRFRTAGLDPNHLQAVGSPGPGAPTPSAAPVPTGPLLDEKI